MMIPLSNLIVPLSLALLPTSLLGSKRISVNGAVQKVGKRMSIRWKFRNAAANKKQNVEASENVEKWKRIINEKEALLLAKDREIGTKDATIRKLTSAVEEQRAAKNRIFDECKAMSAQQTVLERQTASQSAEIARLPAVVEQELYSSAHFHRNRSEPLQR
jgi:hypothetical protein